MTLGVASANDWGSHLRLPSLIALTFLTTSLLVLYSVDIFLPGSIVLSVWLFVSVFLFVFFRVEKIPLLSRSRVAVVFYLYVAIALSWPALFPTIFIAVHSTAFQTADIFSRANHLVALGISA